MNMEYRCAVWYEVEFLAPARIPCSPVVMFYGSWDATERPLDSWLSVRHPSSIHSRTITMLMWSTAIGLRECARQEKEHKSQIRNNSNQKKDSFSRGGGVFALALLPNLGSEVSYLNTTQVTKYIAITWNKMELPVSHDSHIRPEQKSYKHIFQWNIFVTLSVSF
jgi:hypothetical protein